MSSHQQFWTLPLPRSKTNLPPQRHTIKTSPEVSFICIDNAPFFKSCEYSSPTCTWLGPPLCSRRFLHSDRSSDSQGEESTSAEVLEHVLRFSFGPAGKDYYFEALGRQHHRWAAEPLEAFPGVHSIATTSAPGQSERTRLGDHTVHHARQRDEPENAAVVTADLRQESSGNRVSTDHAGAGDKNDDGGTARLGRLGSGTSSASHAAATSDGTLRQEGSGTGDDSTRATQQQPAEEVVHSPIPAVEDSESFRRRVETDARPDHSAERHGDDDRLERQDQVKSQRSEPSGSDNHSGARQGISRRSPGGAQQLAGGSTAASVHNHLVRPISEGGAGRHAPVSKNDKRPFHGAQHQGGCDRAVGAGGGRRQHQTGNSVPDLQAQAGSRPGGDGGSNTRLHPRQGAEGATEPQRRSDGAPSMGGNKSPISSTSATIVDSSDMMNNNNNSGSKKAELNVKKSTYHGASLKMRRHDSKRADSFQLQQLPYHSKPVQKYNMEKIFERANERTLARLKESIREVERPFGEDYSGGPVTVLPSKDVKKKHVEDRLKNGTILRVSADDEAKYPSLGVVNEFCVVETKKKGDVLFDRLRQIDHPIQQNEAARSRQFRTTAPLKHISSYLPRIKSPMGLIADIAASFYGFALSDPVARSYYRFRDTEGSLYELSTLMMGHVAAVEIQQIITSILAGHKDYVKQQYFAPSVPEIWVDNIRFVGEESELKKCEQFLVSSAEACNVSLDIEAITHEYEFLGATWNHKNGTVVAAKKTLEKLPERIPEEMSAGALEQLIGRLIFVAQITQQPLIRHYWLMKWSRRFFNKLNNGTMQPEDTVKIPSSARFSLIQWLHISKKPHKVRFSNITTKSGTLFTDASLKGWGGILVLNDGSIHLVGGKFSAADHNNNINKAEAMALLFALKAFRNILSTLNRVDVFVDNSSVEATVRRGMAKSEDLAEQVKNIWEEVINSNVGMTVDRVATDLNPADSISRGQVMDLKKLERAIGFTKSRSTERKGLEERHMIFSE